MVLERLDGKDTAKLMGKDTFHDIHYIREMLFSVFCALDVSQKQLGFHHSDLRLPNIMDIGPEPADSGLKPRGQQPLSFPGKSVMANQEGPGLSRLLLCTYQRDSCGTVSDRIAHPLHRVTVCQCLAVTSGTSSRI